MINYFCSGVLCTQCRGYTRTYEICADSSVERLKRWRMLGRPSRQSGEFICLSDGAALARGAELSDTHNREGREASQITLWNRLLNTTTCNLNNFRQSLKRLLTRARCGADWTWWTWFRSASVEHSTMEYSTDKTRNVHNHRIFHIGIFYGCANCVSVEYFMVEFSTNAH